MFSLVFNHIKIKILGNFTTAVFLQLPWVDTLSMTEGQEIPICTLSTKTTHLYLYLTCLLLRKGFVRLYFKNFCKASTATSKHPWDMYALSTLVTTFEMETMFKMTKKKTDYMIYIFTSLKICPPKKKKSKKQTLSYTIHCIITKDLFSGGHTSVWTWPWWDTRTCNCGHCL